MKNRDAEMRYRSLVDNSGGGLTITEINDHGISKNVFTSDGMLRLMHMTPQQWAAKSGDDIYSKVHPDDVDKAKSIFSEPGTEGESRSASYRLKCADGGYTWVNVTGRAYTEHGKKYISAVHTDITKQKESEQKEHETRELLASVLGGITCGVCAYDYSPSELSAGLLFANQSYYAIFGYTKAQFDSEVKNTLDLVFPEDRAMLLRAIQTAYLTENAQTLDYRCIKRGGDIIWVSANSRVTDIFGSSKQVLLSETVDITRRKRMADEKAAMLDQITFLNRTAGDLLSVTDADSAFYSGLNDILNYFDGQRSYIFEFDTAKKTASNTYEVCAPNAAPAKDLLQNIPFDAFSVWFDLFDKDGCIAISDVSALDANRSTERELLEMQQISSLLVVPLKKDGTIIGMMGVDDPKRNVDRLPRLQAISDYISAMISRRNMARELSENNFRMETMMNDAPGGFAQMEVHANGSVSPVFLNDGFCRMLGMTGEQAYSLYDNDASAGVHPDDRAELFAALNKLTPDNPVFTARIKLITSTGAYLSVEAYYRLWERHDGRRFLNGYYRDISDRIAKEEEYRRNLAYRDITGRNTLASYHINITKNILDDPITAEPAILALGADGTIDGFLKRSIPMQRSTRLTDFYDHFSQDALLAAMARGQTQVAYEHAFRLSPTRTLWLRTIADLFTNPDTGDIEGFIYAIDSTEERLVSLIMKAVVDNSFDFIVAIQVNTKKYSTFVSNKGADTAFRKSGIYDNANTIRSLLSIIHPQDREAAFKSLRLENLVLQLEDKKSTEFRYRVLIDGQVKYKRCSFTYLDEGREYIMLARTDETETVENLQAALEKAEIASHAKGEFLSRVSHDMRTPLNAVLGFTQLAQEESSASPETMDYLKKIRDSGRYLLGLINDVLDMSKIEEGKMQLNPEPYFYHEFSDTIRTIIEPKAKEKGVEFIMSCNVDKPEALMFDKLRLQQIFINLLNNAVKFTPKGGRVEFNIVAHPPTADGRLPHTFTVRDNGIGMSRDFVENKLFQAFEQERETDGQVEAGTGLGLSIAKQLVEKMGGSIACQSEPGKGTTFTVQLFPLKGGRLADDSVKSADSTTLLRGIRVLLCEDNPLNAQIAVKLLEKQRISTDVAVDGKAGVERFAAAAPETYDIILMDIRMPHMDGLAATKAIRALERADAKTIPIVAMSANAFDDDVRASIEAGMNAHLSKPVDARKLYEAIAEQLRRKKAQGK